MIIDGVHSDWRNIEAGVPEGSVLVPLLFLVYINNLRATISSRFFYLQMIAFCRKKFSLLVIALLSLIMTWHQYLIGLNGGWWLWMKLRLNQLFFGKKRYTFSPLFDFGQQYYELRMWQFMSILVWPCLLLTYLGERIHQKFIKKRPKN